MVDRACSGRGLRTYGLKSPLVDHGGERWLWVLKRSCLSASSPSVVYPFAVDPNKVRNYYGSGPRFFNPIIRYCGDGLYLPRSYRAASLGCVGETLQRSVDSKTLFRAADACEPAT